MAEGSSPELRPKANSSTEASNSFLQSLSKDMSSAKDANTSAIISAAKLIRDNRKKVISMEGVLIGGAILGGASGHVPEGILAASAYTGSQVLFFHAGAESVGFLEKIAKKFRRSRESNPNPRSGT
ncbi:MAG: hypothetical protein NUV69_00125 [Candidatus Curtissbacteria bacterium]|nr:hypothetical protein [Candidatus Curtissbacteria bacterium]